MTVVDRIMEQAGRLTATERKIAEVLAGEPQTIAFGTVAQVAQRAGTSGPSVVRLAVKLGYGGFVDLQSDVQQELARQLGPARERIRQQPPTDLLGQVQAAEHDNVARTLHEIPAETLEGVVDRLADRDHRVWVMPGEMTLAVGITLAANLAQLREGVHLVSGAVATMGRNLADLHPGDTVVGIDIRRYERTLVQMLQWTAAHDAAVVALTDSPLSPLAGLATETFFISAQGIGPFDSMTGALALVNVLVAGAAVRLRPSAARRLDTIEAAWAASGAVLMDHSTSTSADPPGYEPGDAGWREGPALPLSD